MCEGKSIETTKCREKSKGRKKCEDGTVNGNEIDIRMQRQRQHDGLERTLVRYGMRAERVKTNGGKECNAGDGAEPKHNHAFHGSGSAVSLKSPHKIPWPFAAQSHQQHSQQPTC